MNDYLNKNADKAFEEKIQLNHNIYPKIYVDDLNRLIFLDYKINMYFTYFYPLSIFIYQAGNTLFS